MSKEELEKLLIDTMLEGVRFGRELESSKDKESLLPIAINTAVKWRVKEILNQTDEMENKK